MQRISQLLSYYFTAIPDLISFRNYRFYLVGHVAYNFALTVHSLWAVLFAILGVPQLFVFNLFSVGIFIGCILLNRRGHHMLPTVVGMAEVVTHQVVACYLLGTGSGYQLYILVVSLYPFIMPSWRPWIKAVLFAGSLAGYLFIELVLKVRTPQVVLEPGLLGALNISNIVFGFVCLGIWGIYFSFGMRKTEEQLDAEFDKSEQLLLNILPRSIAERLKAREPIISDRLPDASILFADLVGFTRFAENVAPDELVRILNEYFSAFDALADRFGMEKIKTIGDAYMVAAGVPKPDGDHARNIGRFALEMLAVLDERNTHLGHAMQLRIGIHCGPVAAGVIGTRKFAYDLWGDTVNVASRMESLGVPGRIQITESFQRACCDYFAFEERGLVEVKGKGQMRTWFLAGPLR
ncbi:MAG: adenylate/guanylate cyclase domain-containing protein [Flavobacteriales bacterium]|nr:adenylate/guanylate cyclase domain-containing protein [Flavobacteriales bacterium]